ncbi:hypothetical protein COCVIDRAFT_18796 [Bipolaris victoriae FI3]|uniref:Cell wall protein PhiA n=2 Tax=Bipolaris TaxID=33194 RepID=W6XRT5_COCC2|nr:uncharacterized protein COCCADRAFT_30621 [Bipolaris zeicola 26-R-13]XP_014553314.1 hypothetical protein COCVIDRAFT_18796 [Bipolaris victoriae FI3]EUC28035.1 hypothetical protein COCCADRAFT_30621 [Bipolaris zeicola 26-R-13]
MKFTTAAIATSVAALAAASPLQTRADDTPLFWTSRLFAIAPGTDFDGKFLQAANSSLLIGLKDQGASCGPDPRDYATFVFGNGTLSLYTANPPQQFYTAADGMGQGNMRYTTGAEPLPRNALRDGFFVDNHGTLKLQFTPTAPIYGLQACPIYNAPGQYKVWMDAFEHPAGQNCTKFEARVDNDWTPEKCHYSE